MMWNDYYSSGMPMFFGPLMMIAVIAICIGMMFFMLRGGMHRHGSGRDPLDILKERFARGDINQVEYEERKRLLQA
ncbi:MAG: SHOCT domain-containing protein [Hyphomicrobiales bacterium]